MMGQMEKNGHSPVEMCEKMMKSFSAAKNEEAVSE
jgi:hypothetical protein